MLSDIESDERTVLEAVEEHEIVCEAQRVNINYQVTWQCDQPACWVMYRRDHGCGVKLHTFMCNSCKDKRILNTTYNGRVICDRCGLGITPASTVYSRVEPL